MYEKIIKYKKKTRGKWLCHLMSPLSKDETVLICVHGISGTRVHEHISPLLGEHPRIVNIFLGPVTVHYREVSLYLKFNFKIVITGMSITYLILVDTLKLYSNNRARLSMGDQVRNKTLNTSQNSCE